MDNLSVQLNISTQTHKEVQMQEKEGLGCWSNTLSRDRGWDLPHKWRIGLWLHIFAVEGLALADRIIRKQSPHSGTSV